MNAISMLMSAYLTDTIYKTDKLQNRTMNERSHKTTTKRNKKRPKNHHNQPNGKAKTMHEKSIRIVDKIRLEDIL